MYPNRLAYSKQIRRELRIRGVYVYCTFLIVKCNFQASRNFHKPKAKARGKENLSTVTEVERTLRIIVLWNDMLKTNISRPHLFENRTVACEKTKECPVTMIYQKYWTCLHVRVVDRMCVFHDGATLVIITR